LKNFNILPVDNSKQENLCDFILFLYNIDLIKLIVILYQYGYNADYKKQLWIRLWIIFA